MRFLVDSNVFIQAKNRHYGFEICPAFWDWIDRAHAAGAVHSVSRVARELNGGNDRLTDWVRQRASLFMSVDEATVVALREISSWAHESSYEPRAVAEFLDVADAELVAFAKAHRLTVVTHETPSAGRKRIKIPDVCKRFGIDYCDPFAMLAAERARFVLDT